MTAYDAVVVGSGPNGLTAAARLATAGAKVLVLERDEHLGGGTRSAELLVPGVVHDVCSAVHPFGIASPAFQALGLEDHGLRWAHPPVALAHPLTDGDAVLLHRSFDQTADGLDGDADAYRRLMTPLLDRWDDLLPDLLGPVLGVPSHPLVLARFGMPADSPSPSWPAGSTLRAPGRCWPGWRPTPSSPSPRRSPAPSACRWRSPRTPPGGPSPRAARKPSPTRWARWWRATVASWRPATR